MVIDRRYIQAKSLTRKEEGFERPEKTKSFEKS
jgi:hypothetical protein